MTLKKVYLTHTIRNMILSADYLLVFVVVLYVEVRINSIATIDQNKPTIILRGSCYSMIYGNTSQTQKTRREHRTETEIIISHVVIQTTSISLTS